jgi:hypothetical protein
MLPNFPHFTPLHLEFKDTYNKLVGTLPPYSDISFATLQIWWNLSEELSISLLNQNIVIHYHQPFEDHSGLSLIGKNEVEASIKTIFQYLHENNRTIELLHVPEFVVNEIGDRTSLVITEELDYNEYLLDSSALAKLEGPEYSLLRKKIKRFKRTIGERQLELGSLELSLEAVQEQLFASIAEWERDNKPDNDPDHTEHAALKRTLQHAEALDIKNMALFIDKKLHGILIYHQPLGKEYYILHHLKVNYETPYVTDFIHNEMAKHAASNNVSQLNIEMDLGIENLKKHKLTYRPAGYFRKYTVRPA